MPNMNGPVLDDLVTLTLPEARELLQERGVNEADIAIVETAPPIKRSKSGEVLKPFREVRWGHWRVLRVVADTESEKVTLLVAREELAPARVADVEEQDETAAAR